MKKTISEKDSKVEKYEKLIKMLMDNLKNTWVPCPLTTMVEEEEKIEKLNENIPEHSIEISLDSTNYKEESAYLLVNLSKIFIKLINTFKYFNLPYISL